MSSKKVLLIEDEPDVRRSLKMILEEAEYSVLEAKDGVSGEREILLHSPDVIILDLGLPERRGEEILKFIRKHEPTKDIPIIILTGEGSISKRLACMLKGANKFLHKPYDNVDLLKAVKQCLF